jgi:hypothetical protein
VVLYVPPPPVLQQWRQSTRTAHPPSRLVNTFELGNHYVAYETLAVIPEPLEDHPLIVFTATSADPDTMYLHKAMREPDKEKFHEAMEMEVSAHTDTGNFIIVPRHKVPQGVLVIPAVWQMKRKRCISTREFYKWKARLNFDGSKQVKGDNFWETYAPVASWYTIRFTLAMSIISNWHTKQLDFVLAFPQADVKCDDMYMKIPRGFNISKYVALSLVLRDVLPLMGLVKEMQAFGFDCHVTAPKVHCRAFEDNSGALKMATVVHKSCPCWFPSFQIVR